MTNIYLILLTILILILPLGAIIFLAFLVKRSKTPWDVERKQLGYYGLTKEERNAINSTDPSTANKWPRFQIIGFWGMASSLILLFCTYITYVQIILGSSIGYIRSFTYIGGAFFVGYTDNGKVKYGLLFAFAIGLLLFFRTHFHI